MEVDEEQAVMDVLADILEADPAHSEGGKTLESDEDLEKKRPEVKPVMIYYIYNRTKLSKAKLQCNQEFSSVSELEILRRRRFAGWFNNLLHFS